MRYPFLSFALGFLLYFLLLALFAFSFSKENQAPEISLEIDANMIGEINSHESSKTSQQQSQNLEKISEDRNYEKSSDEKLEPKEENPVKEEAETFHKISQKVVPIYQPLPQIPDELRLEAFNSKAVARFFVAANGEVKNVELVKACSDPRLNHLLLKSLRQWKFPPNSTGFIQEINVTFKVE